MIETVRDEEERGTRRKDGRGGRRNEEEGATRRNERRGERSDEESETRPIRPTMRPNVDEMIA